MRGAVLDLGSYTFHGVVAEVDHVGVRRLVLERKVAVRVGDRAHAGISDGAFRRGLETAGKLLARIGARAPDACRVIATGALRDAPNGAQLLADFHTRHGIAVDVLAADAAARLAWLGVSTELAGSHERLAVLDLGGSSLACVAGGEDVEHVTALPLGVLRLADLPPAAVRDAIISATAPALVHLRGADTVALTSGTARALLGLGRRLGLFADAQRFVSARSIGELARRLSPLSTVSVAALGVSPARCDTIGAGAVALATALELLGAPVVYVARAGLREGALVELARARHRASRTSYTERRAGTRTGAPAIAGRE